MMEILALVGVFLAAGLSGPWWSCAPIAFVYGFWKGVNYPRKTIFVWALAAVAAAWLIPALAQDMPVGGRISARIAGLIGVRAPFFSYFAGYLVTVILGAVPAILGLSAGIDLRLAIRPFSSPAKEGRRED